MTCDLPSIEPENSGPLHFLHVNAAIDVERLTGDILPVDNQVTKPLEGFQRAQVGCVSGYRDPPSLTNCTGSAATA